MVKMEEETDYGMDEVDAKPQDEEEAKCLLEFTKHRMKIRKGITIIFTGESGDGKSYAGLRFLQKWYREWFDEEITKERICNSIEEAIILAQKSDRIGEGILIEELSVHAGRRDALSVENKMWGRFFDIIRIKQLVIAGNAPHISLVDNHVIMASQSWVNCEKVDFRNKIVKAHPLWLNISPHRKEPYKHKFTTDDGDEIDYCFFKLPDGDIRKEYDQMKLDSNQNILEEAMEKVILKRKKMLKEMGHKMLPPRELEAYTLHLQGYTNKEGAEKMGLSSSEIFSNTLGRAKKKLLLPEYQKFAKLEFEKSQKHQKSLKNDNAEDIS